MVVYCNSSMTVNIVCNVEGQYGFLILERELTMAPKLKEHPRYHVVSTRLDDEASEWITKLAAKSKVSVAKCLETIVQQVKAWESKVV